MQPEAFHGDVTINNFLQEPYDKDTMSEKFPDLHGVKTIRVFFF